MLRILAACALACAIVSTTAEARPRSTNGFSPECNITMPCIGAPVPSYLASKPVTAREARRIARGQALEAKLPFGRALAPDTQKKYLARKSSRNPQTVNTFGNLHLSGSGIVAIARRELGNGPIYGRRNLWCARFMNTVLERAGYRGTGSDLARSFADKKPRISMQVGAIAVMHRGRRGGHVGIVSGIAKDGNPIIISGNHNNRVREAEYPRGRIYAFVSPD